MPTERPPEVLDDLLAALGHGRRRLVCHLLADGVGSASFDDLADAVAARERSFAADDALPHDHREHVAVDLHHVQLPKLVAVGVVAYDADAGTVEYRPDDLVKELLGYDARFAEG